MKTSTPDVIKAATTESHTMEANREEKKGLLPRQSNSTNSGHVVQPPDRFQLVYIIFLYLGVATLLPWNFFITAKHYFDYKFRNLSLPDDVPYDVGNATTSLQNTFESYLSILAMLANLIFLAFAMVFIRSISINIRMLFSLSPIICIFITTVALVKVDTDSWQLGFFWFTLISASVMVGLTAVLTGTTFGLSCLFPPRYTRAVMAGQAVGGTLSAVLNIMTIAIGEDPRKSAFGFFLTATVCTLLAIVAYIALYHLKYSKFYMANQEDADRNVYDSNVEMPSSRELLSKWQFLSYIIKNIWPYFLTACLVFFVTLACFPAVVSLITSVNYQAGDPWTDTYFSPVVCFLIFNVADLMGRTFVNFIRWPRNGQTGWILALSVARLVFLPLFMMCNIHPTSRKYFPAILKNDVWPPVLNLVMGVSNGYLGTLAMMYGPTQVDLDYAEGAGMVMTMGMTLGLALGSLLSLLLVSLI